MPEGRNPEISRRRLRMSVNHQDIADRLGLARSTVTKILNQLPNNRANRETIKKVFKTAREMGYDFSRLRNIHRRRADRKNVDLLARIKIQIKNNGLYDAGTVKVLNLSPYGALLAEIRTSKKSLPLLPFSIDLEILDPPLQGVSAECQLIRLMTRKNIEIGVNFSRIKTAAEKKIIDFLRG
jgi:transcriptional regulator with XRE-family HTH domain